MVSSIGAHADAVAARKTCDVVFDVLADLEDRRVLQQRLQHGHDLVAAAAASARPPASVERAFGLRAAGPHGRAACSRRRPARRASEMPTSSARTRSSAVGLGVDRDDAGLVGRGDPAVQRLGRLHQLVAARCRRTGRAACRRDRRRRLRGAVAGDGAGCGGRCAVDQPAVGADLALDAGDDRAEALLPQEAAAACRVGLADLRGRPAALGTGTLSSSFTSRLRDARQLGVVDQRSRGAWAA